MIKKQVLIITYYWPPSGGVGVYRWLKFAKYLPEFGWEPVVFTPEEPGHQLKDESLLKESKNIKTIRSRIWEPFKLFKGASQGKQHGTILEKPKKGFADFLKIWIRGNIFIPDPRVFWVRPAIKEIGKLLAENKITHVITTGPPHSIHLIGLGLRKKHQIKWIADFRDPWSNWDIYNKMHMSGLSRRLHRRLELKVLEQADVVSATGKSLGENFLNLGARKVSVITNGFDPDDLPEKKADTAPGDRFVVAYYGLLNELRNPENLWLALEELIEENQEFAEKLRVDLGGIISESIKARLYGSHPLKERINFKGYLQHDQIYREYRKASLLLLLLNDSSNAKWILPAKLFEYFSVGKPVLMIGSTESDAAEMISKYNYGASCNFADKSAIKDALLSNFQLFLKGGASRNMNTLHKFSRVDLTRKLADLLNEL